ncbi:MAG: hypothetical protein AB9891_00690 [Anaerolineaceae bacterium]
MWNDETDSNPQSLWQVAPDDSIILISSQIRAWKAYTGLPCGVAFQTSEVFLDFGGLGDYPSTIQKSSPVRA